MAISKRREFFPPAFHEEYAEFLGFEICDRSFSRGLRNLWGRIFADQLVFLVVCNFHILIPRLAFSELDRPLSWWGSRIFVIKLAILQVHGVE